MRVLRSFPVRWGPYSPALVALLLMLPRLLSPEFGLLDDGQTIRAAGEIAQHPGAVLGMAAGTGRFMPAYWFYYTFLYSIAWAQPFLFFVANYVLLATTGVALVYFMLCRGASRLQAVSGGLLFVLSGPAIENFYTLSKAEPLQVAMLVSGLALLAAMQRSAGRLSRALLSLGAAGAFFLACCAKETSVVLIPISVAWFFTRRQKGSNDGMGGLARFGFVATAFGAVGLFVMLRWVTSRTSISAGSYTRNYQFTPDRIFCSVGTWASWLVRDFPYLLPLALFVAWRLRCKEQTHGRLLGDASIWMAGWVAVFLPWWATLEFHLLPFAVGCAVFGGVALGQLVESLRLSPGSRWLRAAAVTVVLLFAVTQVNNATAAKYQLTIDRTNAELMEYLSRLPDGSTVFVNLPQPNEYVYEIGVRLGQLRGRPDIPVDYFNLQAASTDQQRISYHVATPVFENQTLPSPRCAVQDTGAREWGRALTAFVGRRAVPDYETLSRMRIVDFGLHRLLCPFLKSGVFCSVPRPPLDTRQMVYGWRVYKVSSSVDSMDLPAVFRPDGTWVFRLASGAVKELHFGQAGDLPVAGDWNGDGRTEIGVFRPSTLTWYLDKNMNGKAVEIRVQGMRSGDIPLMGDWEGHGIATPAYFRPSDASWHFFSDLAGQDEDKPVVGLGTPTDTPIVADWTGSGRTSVGIYRKSTGEVDVLETLAPKARLIVFTVAANATPVAGDWSGQGVQTLALVKGREWSPSLNCNCIPSNPGGVFEFDATGGIPLAGKWRIR